MRCDYCGSDDECHEDCECAKCMNPEQYADWKENNPEEYSDWLEKKRNEEVEDEKTKT